LEAAGYIVVERGNHRVQVLIPSAATHGSGNRKFIASCGGIGIDNDRRIVEADDWNHCVQVLE